MKNTQEFEDFMVTTVNLNPYRIERLEEGIRVVKLFINNSEYKVKRFASQGSWAHKTIIKPPTKHSDFDVDLLAFVDYVGHWRACDYIDDLYKIFYESEYKEKVTKKTYCVRLNYLDDFHVDIVPCVIYGNGYKVCNRKKNILESTNPEEYTEWFCKTNDRSGKQLVKVVRLLKYLRDINNFNIASIILSTLSGEIAKNQFYTDLPDALLQITRILKEYFNNNEDAPYVGNPVLSTNNLASEWEEDQYKYKIFKDKFIPYANLIEEAYYECNADESIEKWKAIFGKKFKKYDDSSKNLSCYKSSINFGEGTNIQDISFNADQNITPADLDNLYYTESVGEIAEYIDFKINIDINAYFKKNEREDWTPYSSDRFLGIDYKLLFECCTTNTGLTIDKAFEIKWRVTNTGEDAFFSNDLRGKFETSKREKHGFKFERTFYNGLHFIEALVIRNNVLIARSNPFKVKIFESN